jgi:hypothetical protein
MSRADDDFVPVTGGVDLPPDQVRSDLDLRNLTADCDLDKQILRLFALHPQLRIRFSKDLTRLDTEAKRALLDEIYEAIGVRQLGQSPR